MQCPYCGDQHSENAQFCPVTGQPLPTRQDGSRGFYMGLGAVSVLLVTVSLVMLFLNNQGTLKQNKAATTVPDSAAAPIQDDGFPQTGPAGENPQSLPTPNPTSIRPPTSTSTQTSIPYPVPVDIEINPSDGAEIVLIPAGEFLMGSDPAHDPYFWGAESPEHTVTLGSFWIYRTEVTQGMYQKCDEQDACPAPVVINNPVAQQYGTPRFKDYPVVMVTWQGALAYCQWAGGRLPTEAEWEKAARGTDGRLFPWGSDPGAENLVNFASSSPEPVGSHPAGSSPYGVYDMAGNVLEWVNDFFESGYYQYSPLDNPLGPASGSRRVIRGGAFNQNEAGGLRTVARASLRPDDTKISVGFRCAVDAP